MKELMITQLNFSEEQVNGFDDSLNSDLSQSKNIN